MNTYKRPSLICDTSSQWYKAVQLLDNARRQNKAIKIYYYTRTFIGSTACFHKEPPIVLKSWIEGEELIYFKLSMFDWKKISFDLIEKIEVIDRIKEEAKMTYTVYKGVTNQNIYSEEIIMRTFSIEEAQEKARELVKNNEKEPKNFIIEIRYNETEYSYNILEY